MKYRIKYSGGFKKSYKLCKRRGYDIQLLEKAITLLANEGKLLLNKRIKQYCKEINKFFIKELKKENKVNK